jgi:hypothetical protein
MTGITVSTVINLGFINAMLAVPVATAGVDTSRPEEPGAEATKDGTCDPCTEPIKRKKTGLVIVTTLTNGGYVSIWWSKIENRVNGQCYTKAGLPLGAQFHINAKVKNKILPVVIAQKNGRFVARWKQHGQHLEQRFNANCVSLGDKPFNLNLGK